MGVAHEEMQSKSALRAQDWIFVPNRCGDGLLSVLLGFGPFCDEREQDAWRRACMESNNEIFMTGCRLTLARNMKEKYAFAKKTSLILSERLSSPPPKCVNLVGNKLQRAPNYNKLMVINSGFYGVGYNISGAVGYKVFKTQVTDYSII